MRSRRLIAMNLVLVFLLGLFVAKMPQTLAQMTGRASPDGMDLIEDVDKMVMANYVEKPDQNKLTKGAIDGMLEALDDPYAEYISAEDAAEFEKQMTGSFSGIGCQIDVRDGWLYVVSPLEESPALHAGILAGDKIIKVDGKSTQNKSADQCIKMITGPEGTTVHIDVQRNAQDLSFDIKRAHIVSRSIRGFRRMPSDPNKWDYLIDPAHKVAYIRMSQFTPTAPKELISALNAAADQAGVEPKDLGGLILDLRYNPGGLMDAAIEICDMFLDKGRIMSTKGRNFPEVVYNAEPGTDTPQYPIAILANGFSASASEIVSGCLSEDNRAIVIGTRTFGKGLVQSVSQLPHDPRAGVKFTTQHYYLPSGKLIQRTEDSTDWGVDPSPGFFVPMTAEEETAALLARRNWDILRKPGTPLPEGVEPLPPLDEQHWNDAAWINEHAKDKQLAGAVETMQAKIASGEWKKLSSEADQHGRIHMAELKTIDKSLERIAKEVARLEKRRETLETVAADGKEEPKIKDLWADAVDPTGGTVEVKDKNGKVLADLKITGRDLERWLAISDVEKVGPDSAESKPADSKNTAKQSDAKP